MSSARTVLYALFSRALSIFSFAAAVYSLLSGLLRTGEAREYDIYLSKKRETVS